MKRLSLAAYVHKLESVHITEVDWAVLAPAGQARANRGRIEPVVFELIERQPVDTSLPDVCDGPVAWLRARQQRAAEHDLQAVDVALVISEFVIDGDIVAYHHDVVDLDIASNFFPTFASHGLGQRFPVLDPSARKQEPFPVRIIVTTIVGHQQMSIPNDDRLHRRPDMSHELSPSLNRMSNLMRVQQVTIEHWTVVRV